ncbi:MAG: hypothetical protein MJ053_03140 [Elusimicrobiaceae bacterium]|nr:hypothetical protein [Elusimicrobiaceae bacterium]
MKTRTRCLISLGFIICVAVSLRAQGLSELGKGLEASTRAASTVMSGVQSGMMSEYRVTPRHVEKYVSKQLSNMQLSSIRPTIALPDPSVQFSIFQAIAPGIDAEKANVFSGTVFTGKDGNMYGVIPAHSLAHSEVDRALPRHFNIRIYRDGYQLDIPAHVAVAGAASMLDLALVEIPQEATSLFKPVEIDRRLIQRGDEFATYGFVNGQLVYMPTRRVSSQTAVAIRTNMPLPRDHRAGLCGALVRDEATGNMVGVHIGSRPIHTDSRAVFGREGLYINRRRLSSEDNDIGYVAPVFEADLLVDAYHNNGEAYFPFQLNGHTLLDLRLDEYISYVKLLDENGKQLWQRGFEFKFGYIAVEEQINALSPRYIEFTVRRAQWDAQNPEFYREMRNKYDKTRMTYRYDFQEGKIVFMSKSKQ